jgi:hypothetical protein
MGTPIVAPLKENCLVGDQLEKLMYLCGIYSFFNFKHRTFKLVYTINLSKFNEASISEGQFDLPTSLKKIECMVLRQTIVSFFIIQSGIVAKHENFGHWWGWLYR